MGRELRRKEAKRSGKNVREVQNKNKEKYMTPKSLVIILISVLVLFGLTYLFTGIFATKDIKLFNKKEDKEETVSKISNKILASDSLKQKDDVYYVYYYNSTEEDNEVADSIYGINETVYRVDLNDGFNANFVGEPSGIVDSIDDLRVSDPTVIRVESGKMVAFYSGKEEIKNIN